MSRRTHNSTLLSLTGTAGKRRFLFSLSSSVPQRHSSLPFCAITHQSPTLATDPSPPWGQGRKGSSSDAASARSPSVFASPADLRGRAGPGPPSRCSPGHKPPAGTATLGGSYFAKSDELKVTLKMEGNRSVTYGLLIALTIWFLHGSLSNAGTLPTVNGGSNFVWLKKTQSS